VTEKELLGAVVELARALGWRVARFPKVPVKYPAQPVRWMTPVEADGKGWLDLLLLRERPLAVEIKAREDSYDRRLPDAQQAWYDAWRVAGVRAFVWTPEDWRDGTVERELADVVRHRPPVVEEQSPLPQTEEQRTMMLGGL
jgi:hypothetical protein